MKTSLIKNLIIGTTLATGVVAMTWNGGATLQSAKETISGYVSTIEIFKDNETKLVNKINSLNQEKALIETQLKEKDVNIQELTTKLDGINAEIESYKTQLANAETQLDNANIEITKANNEAKELQAYIDTLVNTPQPIDVTDIVGEEPITPPSAESTPNPEPTKENTWDGVGEYKNQYITAQVIYEDYRQIRITSVNNDDKTNPLKIFVNNSNKGELYFGGNLQSDLSVPDTNNYIIEIKSKDGDLLFTLNVNLK